MNKITIQTEIKKIGQLIQDGIDAWRLAGEIVVKLLDSDGLSIHDIVAQSDNEFVTPNLIAQFERIGRNQVLPKLLVLDFPAAKKLQRMPISEQSRLVEGKVEFLLLRDGKADTLNVSVRDLTKDQCKQVFSGDEVRTLSAQRAYLEDCITKTQINSSSKQFPWTIKNGKVYFVEGCEISRHELAVILAQLG